jgi:hypothetical protein
MRTITVVRVIIGLVVMMMSHAEADCATRRGPRIRRPEGANINCLPEVREIMGGQCHCIKNAIKENVPPYEGQQVVYRFYCSSNHLDRAHPGDVCIYHSTCDPGDILPPREGGRSDLPPFGVYNPQDIFP